MSRIEDQLREQDLVAALVNLQSRVSHRYSLVSEVLARLTRKRHIVLSSKGPRCGPSDVRRHFGPSLGSGENFRILYKRTTGTKNRGEYKRATFRRGSSKILRLDECKVRLQEAYAVIS